MHAFGRRRMVYMLPAFDPNTPSSFHINSHLS
jgi:hypothetical protein